MPHTLPAAPKHLPWGPGLSFLSPLTPTSLDTSLFIPWILYRIPAELAVKDWILIRREEKGKLCRLPQRQNVLWWAGADGAVDREGWHAHTLMKFVPASQAMWQLSEDDIISTLWWTIWTPGELSKVTDLTSGKIRTKVYRTTKPTIFSPNHERPAKEIRLIWDDNKNNKIHMINFSSSFWWSRCRGGRGKPKDAANNSHLVCDPTGLSALT